MHQAISRPAAADSPLPVWLPASSTILVANSVAAPAASMLIGSIRRLLPTNIEVSG
jgi:hypothetical protein